MFPATQEFVVGSLGITLLLLAWLHHSVDRNPRVLRYEGVLGVVTVFSRYSFTVYVLHHVVHLWPLWIYGAFSGPEPTFYWRNAMPVWAAAVLGVVFLVCCYGILRGLGPDRTFGIESCMRWLCD